VRSENNLMVETLYHFKENLEGDRRRATQQKPNNIYQHQGGHSHARVKLTQAWSSTNTLRIHVNIDQRIWPPKIQFGSIPILQDKS